MFVGLLALAAIAIGLTALINPNIVSNLYQSDGETDMSSSTGGSLTVNVAGAPPPSDAAISLSTMSKTYLIAFGTTWGAHEFM